MFKEASATQSKKTVYCIKLPRDLQGTGLSFVCESLFLTYCLTDMLFVDGESRGFAIMKYEVSAASQLRIYDTPCGAQINTRTALLECVYMIL